MQEDGRVMVKDLCNGAPFTIEKIPAYSRFEPGTA